MPHDGRSVEAAGFRKRVVYLERDALDPRLIGAAVDHPGWADRAPARRDDRLHEALAHPGDAFEAESRLALVRDRLGRHLTHAEIGPTPASDSRVARAAA